MFDQYLVPEGYDATSTIVFFSQYAPLVLSGDVDELEKTLDRNWNTEYLSSMDNIDQFYEIAVHIMLGVYLSLLQQAEVPMEYSPVLTLKYIERAKQIRSPEDLSNCLCDMAVSFAKEVQAYRLYCKNGKLSKLCYQYICAHIREPISISSMAEVLGYSESGLQHGYKRETRETLTQFIKREKVRYAKYLLVSTNKSIADISYQLGYSSQSHFIAVFRSVEGQTPLEYRKNVNNH